MASCKYVKGRDYFKDGNKAMVGSGQCSSIIEVR